MDFPRRFAWSMLSWRLARRPESRRPRTFPRTSTSLDGHETAALPADCPACRPRPRRARLRWQLDERPVERRRESRRRHDHEGAVQLPDRRCEALVQGTEDGVSEARDVAVQAARGPGGLLPRAAGRA